jgi:CRP/FNR family cyclic AMP-dependent transcriptional regulator
MLLPDAAPAGTGSGLEVSPPPLDPLEAPAESRVPVDLLRQCELFGDLCVTEMSRVAAICQPETYPAGTLIFGQDDVAEKIYVLQEGRIAIAMHLRSEGEPAADLTMEESVPGHIFGWSALVRQQRFTACATALDPVKVLAIQSADLHALFDEDAHIGFTVMKRLADVISARLRLTRRSSEHPTGAEQMND